jgi:hypothetical protein
MRLEGQLPQQPLLRHYYEQHYEHYYYDSHNLDLDEHDLDLHDAYVHTEWQLHPLHRRLSVLRLLRSDRRTLRQHYLLLL